MSIGVPARRSTSLISVVASTAAQSQVRTAHRTRQPTARGVGGLGPVAPKRISSDNRDHDTLVTQHRRLQALQHHFRLLAHDERADVGVEHRSCSQVKSTFIADNVPTFHHKVRFGFFKLRERAPGRPDGTQDDTVPSRTIFSSLTPSKSRSRGRRMVLRKTSGNGSVPAEGEMTP